MVQLLVGRCFISNLLVLVITNRILHKKKKKSHYPPDTKKSCSSRFLYLHQLHLFLDCNAWRFPLPRRTLFTVRRILLLLPSPTTKVLEKLFLQRCWGRRHSPIFRVLSIQVLEGVCSTRRNSTPQKKANQLLILSFSLLSRR